MNAATKIRYWEDWKKITDFEDNDLRTVQLFEDDGGKVHLVKHFQLVDGVEPENEYHCARFWFEERGIPYDSSRVSFLYFEKQISMMEAARVWAKSTAPEEFIPFLL